MARTPDEIMQDFEDAVRGLKDLSPNEILGEILEDVLDSVLLAEQRLGVTGTDIHDTVNDYVSNHYGDWLS